MYKKCWHWKTNWFGFIQTCRYRWTCAYSVRIGPLHVADHSNALIATSCDLWCCLSAIEINCQPKSRMHACLMWHISSANRDWPNWLFVASRNCSPSRHLFVPGSNTIETHSDLLCCRVLAQDNYLSHNAVSCQFFNWPIAHCHTFRVKRPSFVIFATKSN